MTVLGINAYHGDVSAVLLRDGDVIAAVEEERLRRIKHVAGFPRLAIGECLRIGGLTGRDIDHVAVSRRPRAHLWRKGLFAASRLPSRRLLRDRATNYRRVTEIPATLAATLGLDGAGSRPTVHWVEHHPSHLASAYFASPFDEAAVCAIDGFGDFVSTSWAVGRGARLEVRHRTFFPHSIGVFYLALTQFLGFPRYGDEFKVMGLAPYGSPEFVSALANLVRKLPGGGIALDLSYFTHWSGRGGMTWDDGEPVLAPVYSARLESLLGPRRRPDEPITPRHEAIAASVQAVFEDLVFHVLEHVYRCTGLRRLCLAGGCAMNSVANGRIRTRTAFEDVFIQPAAGDNGTALGAALWVWHTRLGQQRRWVMTHALLGPSYGASAIDAALAERAADLAQIPAITRRFTDEDALCDTVAAHLANGGIVGWFQGRMEWGARALGNRSILADPRRADMREVLNARIKLREPFRPFAPAVLEESRAEFFDGAPPDPFMMQVYPIRPEKRSVVPAVTHVDGTGRLQTVNEAANPRFWRLLRAFERRTGVPMLLNTSFNENEPIVGEPAQALDCFLRTGMDVLVLGDTMVTRPGAEGGAR